MNSRPSFLERRERSHFVVIGITTNHTTDRNNKYNLLTTGTTDGNTVKISLEKSPPQQQPASEQQTATAIFAIK